MGFLSCCIGLFVYTYTKNLIPQCLHYCSFRADLGLYKARHPLLSYSGSSSGRTWLFWTLRSPEQLQNQLVNLNSLFPLVAFNASSLSSVSYSSTMISLNMYLFLLLGIQCVLSSAGFQSFNTSGKFCLYTLNKLTLHYGEIILHRRRSCFVSRGTDSSGSGMTFPGCLHSEQPQKIKSPPTAEGRFVYWPGE